MKTKIIFLISAFFILKTPSFSQSGLQKSKSIGANLSQYSGSPESVATKLYGEKLILTDVDWFRFVIDQADKNLDKNYKEKGYGEFLFSYNNASVKGLRSRAILYQNKKKEYRLFISVPLKHHKSLNQNLANEIFTFQSLMDEFDRLSCGEKFISFLWISYGNFDYITELNPAKKNENTFVVTSDVFSNEGRVEMHSEYLRRDLEEPIKSAFKNANPSGFLLSKLVLDNIAEKNGKVIPNYKYHFNYPEYDFERDPVAPLVQAIKSKKASLTSLYQKRMYLHYGNRARHTPFLFDDGGNASTNFGSCVFSYYDHNGNVAEYQNVRTTPVGFIERGRKFETNTQTLDIFKFLKAFEFYKPLNAIDLLRSVYVSSSLPGYNNNYICTSEFKFIINPCEMGFMPDVDQSNTQKLRKVTFKNHFDFLPWVVMAGGVIIKSGMLQYLDNYSRDFKPNAKQFELFIDALKDIRTIRNLGSPIPYFGIFTYRYLTSQIYWPSANLAALSQLRYIANKDIQMSDFIGKIAKPSRNSRQANNNAELNVINTIAEKSTIKNLRVEIYDHNTGNIMLAPTTRSGNLFISQLPKLSDMPAVGQIKSIPSNNDGEQESIDMSYAVFDVEKLLNYNALSTAYPTFAVELSECTKQKLGYLFMCNSIERSTIDMYGRASELIKLKADNKIRGSISISYTETDADDLLNFVQEYLGASEAIDYEDYLKIFSLNANGEWEELNSYNDKLHNVATAELPANNGSLTLAVYPSGLPNVNINIPEKAWTIYPEANKMMPFYEKVFADCNTRIKNDGDNFVDNSNVDASSKLISVSPNPLNGNKNLFLTKLSKEDVSLEIFNVLGEQVLTHQLNEKQQVINLKSVSSGVYFIKANNTVGTQMIKFVVE